MARNVDIISKEEIQSILKSRFFGKRIYAFEAIDSTNLFAKSLAAKGESEGTLVYAETQTAGRGRWGRVWDSAAGKGLWFSILLRPAMNIEKVLLLTLLAATSIATGVEKRLGIVLSVKWPNDLLVQNKKVAGVLLETSQQQCWNPYVVMGVGLNVCQKKEDFPPEIQESATSLEMASGLEIDRRLLFSDLLCQLEQDYQKSQKEGFDFILNQWVCRSSILDRDISFKVNDRNIQGRVKGFHANGDLVLIRPDGRQERYRSGDVCEVRHVDCH